MLDHMLFLNKPLEGMFIDEETITEFKAAYNEALKNITMSEGEEFVSPFVADEVRNYCSRHSFIITNSVAQENKIVKVDVPHFKNCERIPLRRTPLFSSYNETIDFLRTDNETMPGHFDLYRLRFNNMYVERDLATGDVVKEERVAADFIDVSIAAKNDTELIDFWNNGRCMTVLEPASRVWICVPDIPTCINDLYKMLYVYECPEGKKNKRMDKFNKLKELIGMP